MDFLDKNLQECGVPDLRSKPQWTQYTDWQHWNLNLFNTVKITDRTGLQLICLYIAVILDG